VYFYYFVTDQSENENRFRKDKGEKWQFPDDCQAWKSVRSVRLHYEGSTTRQLLLQLTTKRHL